jgi:phospholipid transport system substrate-binding protein
MALFFGGVFDLTGERDMDSALYVKKKRMFNRMIGMIIFLCAFLMPQSGGASQTGAAGVIKTFNATLLEAMKKARELGYSGRYKILEPVIKDSFALSFMANQSVGRYGKTLSEEQRNLLTKMYTDWTIATYAGRFDGYSGERFEVVSESAPAHGTVTVISKLIKPDREEIEFYYILRKNEGKWRIADIQISGVSQLALTRSQFLGILKNKGFDGLISMLKEKTKRFSKGEET